MVVIAPSMQVAEWWGGCVNAVVMLHCRHRWQGDGGSCVIVIVIQVVVVTPSIQVGGW